MAEPAESSPAIALGRTAAGLALIVVVIFAAALLWKERVVAGAVAFVDLLGPWGVALGFFLPDLTALPLPHDVFLAAGRLGGLSFGTLVVWASTGSILGGLGAWGAGRAVAGTAWFERRDGPKIERARRLFDRYGAWALGVSALTPLPYSLLAWISGGLGMGIARFAAISLLRIARVALYLWIIDKGFVEVVL